VIHPLAYSNSLVKQGMVGTHCICWSSEVHPVSSKA
jgi:hypothetical protein